MSNLAGRQPTTRLLRPESTVLRELDSKPMSRPNMATEAKTILSADAAADLLVTVIQGVAGGTKSEWRKVVGEIERHPAHRFVRFNWSVTPTGTAKQRDVIERAVEIVRAAHPYIFDA